MPTIPKEIEAVIGKVTPNAPGKGWDIALEPDCTTWLTMHEDEAMSLPLPGDIVMIQPPYITEHHPHNQI